MNEKTAMNVIRLLLKAKRKAKHHDLELTQELHQQQRALEKEYGVLGAELDGLGSECADCGSEDFEWTWCEHEEKGEEEITPLCETCIILRIEQGWEDNEAGWRFVVSDEAESYWYGEYLGGVGDW